MNVLQGAIRTMTDNGRTRSFLLLDILTGRQRYAELDNGSAQECSVFQVGQIIFTDSKVERPNRSSVVGTLLDYVDAEDGQEHEIWCDSHSQVFHSGD